MSQNKKLGYKFFISYRRDDHPDFVEHIRSWFAWHYGRSNVFMDFDSIPVGVPFPQNIHEQVRRCDALLAIIGPNWLDRILKDPFSEDDWVRIEIATALKEQKLVVPIYIKGASIPELHKLPPELRGILNIQGAFLDSGQNFIDRIEDAMASIEDLLATRVSRKQEIQRLDEISPASGLALGYYANFVRPVGNQLVALNADPKAEGSPVGIRVEEQALDINQPLTLILVIPSRITFLKYQSLEIVRQTLVQAVLESSAFSRPFTLYARASNHTYQLIDFPTTITVLEYWLKRRLQEEGLNPESEEALRLETEELGRFKKSLMYWIDDQANDPAFRDHVQVISYNSDDPQLEWLSKLWDRTDLPAPG